MVRSPSGALAALPVPDRNPEEAREAVRRILERPAFRDDRSLLDRMWGWIGDRLGDVLEALTGGDVSGTTVAWVVVAVLTAIAVVLTAAVLRGVRRDPGGSGPTGADLGRPAVDWRDEAAAHEDAGRWRDAVRCRYRSVVADLAADGVVDEVPGRTAGTYRRLVADALPGSADPFAEVTELFEAVWYGGRAAGPAEAERMRSLATDVVEPLRAGRR